MLFVVSKIEKTTNSKRKLKKCSFKIWPQDDASMQSVRKIKSHPLRSLGFDENLTARILFLDYDHGQVLLRNVRLCYNLILISIKEVVDKFLSDHFVFEPDDANDDSRAPSQLIVCNIYMHLPNAAKSINNTAVCARNSATFYNLQSPSFYDQINKVIKKVFLQTVILFIFAQECLFIDLSND